ncbi:hypothetical protein Psal006b_01141 [Piscirickettsia salmonis]|uniref:Serine/threonine protein kinase n=2 Tax=Piscirickettsia salmonis TaxID=1238 RepID=A0A1L6TCW9_PISSA|nr:ATP-binding protein [Piscirickettsia salmonis]ALT18530.1 hypothetical protein PSLF89_2713 [Piscirickettsia salmonis LF-89 = ATCC VR-1361]ALB23242.1 serine/threonine protein kinase [Piscirickettsia salmonis]ALY03153.1 hypothetical protein AWE47_10135 [Piscirickettsia salmonis]AMA42715.1 hypothetical protein AWJ11_10350 [Piscirickettsia salmonis]AOS35187.1 hypothetical protein AVM72_07490 [Piscirickettsia salmonis]
MITFELNQSSDRMQLIANSLASLRSSLSTRFDIKLNLVIEEVVENIFNNNANIDLYVKITINFSVDNKGKISILFCDNGSEFDLTNYQFKGIPNQDVSRGRGIYLIKHYASSISYKRNQHLNILKIMIGDKK